MECRSCDAPIHEGDANSLKHGECFKCRISGGVGFTFTGGGGYGREAFHSGTTAEFDRVTREGAKQNGIELERA